MEQGFFDFNTPEKKYLQKTRYLIYKPASKPYEPNLVCRAGTKSKYIK